MEQALEQPSCPAALPSPRGALLALSSGSVSRAPHVPDPAQQRLVSAPRTRRESFLGKKKKKSNLGGIQASLILIYFSC